MQRIEVNVTTGEQRIVDLTAKEIAALPAPVLPTYQELRRVNYPPITDYIDGIVKGDAVQVQAYIDACLAVKQEFPK